VADTCPYIIFSPEKRVFLLQVSSEEGMHLRDSLVGSFGHQLIRKVGSRSTETMRDVVKSAMLNLVAEGFLLQDFNDGIKDFGLVVAGGHHEQRGLDLFGFFDGDITRVDNGASFVGGVFGEKGNVTAALKMIMHGFVQRKIHISERFTSISMEQWYAEMN
jgi:hypothetical protein